MGLGLCLGKFLDLPPSPPAPQRPYREALQSLSLGRELAAGLGGVGQASVCGGGTFGFPGKGFCKVVVYTGWVVVIVSVWCFSGAVTPDGGLAVVI